MNKTNFSHGNLALNSASGSPPVGFSRDKLSIYTLIAEENLIASYSVRNCKLATNSNPPSCSLSSRSYSSKVDLRSSGLSVPVKNNRNLSLLGKISFLIHQKYVEEPVTHQRVLPASNFITPGTNSNSPASTPLWRIEPHYS